MPIIAYGYSCMEKSDKDVRDLTKFEECLKETLTYLHEFFRDMWNYVIGKQRDVVTFIDLDVSYPALEEAISIFNGGEAKHDWMNAMHVHGAIVGNKLQDLGILYFEGEFKNEKTHWYPRTPGRTRYSTYYSLPTRAEHLK